MIVPRSMSGSKCYLQALDFRQEVLLWHVHVVHGDLASDGSAQGEFAFDLWRAKAFH